MTLPLSQMIRVKIKPQAISAASEVISHEKSESELLDELRNTLHYAGLCTKPLFEMSEAQTFNDDLDSTDPAEGMDEAAENSDKRRRKRKHIRCRFSIRNTVTPEWDNSPLFSGDNSPEYPEECQYLGGLVKTETVDQFGDVKSFRALLSKTKPSNDAALLASNDDVFMPGTSHQQVLYKDAEQILPSSADLGPSENRNNISFSLPEWNPLTIPDHNLFMPIHHGMTQTTVADQDVPNVGSGMHFSPFHNYNGSPETFPVFPNVFPSFPSFKANLDVANFYSSVLSQPVFPHNNVSSLPGPFPWFLHRGSLLSPRHEEGEKTGQCSIGNTPPGPYMSSPQFPLTWPGVRSTPPPVLQTESLGFLQEAQNHSDKKKGKNVRENPNSLAENNATPPVKKRRHRTNFTDEQKAILLQRFVMRDRIEIFERRELATTLGLTERQVLVWFQNQRAKMRNEQSKYEATLLIHQMLQDGQLHLDLLKKLNG